MKTILRFMGIALLTLFAGVVAAKESPLSIDGAITVDTAKARQLFDQGVAFVDVRKNSEWDAGRVPGAIHLDFKSNYSSDALAAEVPKQEQVVLYCNGAKCLRSSNASAKAIEWGWTRVYFYRDGFPAWQAAGHPVE